MAGPEKNQYQSACAPPARKPMSASRATLARVIWPADTNVFGSGHGGVLLRMVDDAAWAAATRHHDGHAVTAAIDELVFLRPVWPGDEIQAVAQVETTGRTAMHIGVYVSARSGPSHRERVHNGRVVNGHNALVVEGHLVFVGVDSSGRPQRVAPVIAETPDEQRASLLAETRRDLRQNARAAMDLERIESGLPSTGNGLTSVSTPEFHST